MTKLFIDTEFNDFFGESLSYILWEDQGVDFFFQKVVCLPRSMHGIILTEKETSTEKGDGFRVGVPAQRDYSWGGY